MKKLFISIVKFYRRVISPLKPPTCRFYPSCSQYSLDAYEKYGALKGTYLTTIRILKCQPFHRGGIDYVPGTEHKYQNKQD